MRRGTYWSGAHCSWRVFFIGTEQTCSTERIMSPQRCLGGGHYPKIESWDISQLLLRPKNSLCSLNSVTLATRNVIHTKMCWVKKKKKPGKWLRCSFAQCAHIVSVKSAARVQKRIKRRTRDAHHRHCSQCGSTPQNEPSLCWPRLFELWAVPQFRVCMLWSTHFEVFDVVDVKGCPNLPEVEAFSKCDLKTCF